jgi:hypothetical protein
MTARGALVVWIGMGLDGFGFEPKQGVSSGGRRPAMPWSGPQQPDYVRAIRVPGPFANVGYASPSIPWPRATSKRKLVAVKG